MEVFETVTLQTNAFTPTKYTNQIIKDETNLNLNLLLVMVNVNLTLLMIDIVIANGHQYLTNIQVHSCSIKNMMYFGVVIVTSMNKSD